MQARIYILIFITLSRNDKQFDSYFMLLAQTVVEIFNGKLRVDLMQLSIIYKPRYAKFCYHQHGPPTIDVIIADSRFMCK